MAVDHNLMIAGAVLLLPPDAAIAGRSAAILWGAAEITAVDRVEVVSPTQFGPVQGLSIRIGTINRSEIDVHRGVRVTSSVHTAWDLARFRPMMEAVQWIDSLARVRRVGRSELIAHGKQHMGARAVRRAAATLRFCDPRAESPPESVLRINLHLDGVQVIPQFWVMVGNQFVARVDLAVPEIKLAIEYDGQWHADHHQLGRDRARVWLLNQAGWYVFQVTKEDMRNIGNLLQEIRSVVDRLKRSRG